jgi:hypothetical protein
MQELNQISDMTKKLLTKLSDKNNEHFASTLEELMRNDKLNE